MCAHEREAVRVDPARGEADDDVAGLDPGAVDHTVAVDDADARPREVDLGVAVDARQLRRLAAEDRAAGGAAHLGSAFDELGDLLELDRVAAT